MTIHRDNKGHIDNHGCLHTVLEQFSYCSADTISPQSFDSPVDVYNLNDQHVRCQFHLHHNACNKLHARGFVVKLKNGNVALIGNCCAYKRLGLDHDDTANKFRRLENKLSLETLESTIAEIQGRREALLDSLKKSELALTPIIEKANLLKSMLPKEVLEAIYRFAQEGNSADLVWLGVYKQKTDKGQDFSRRFPHKVTRLTGLNLWRAHIGVFYNFEKIEEYGEILSKWEPEKLVDAKTVLHARKKIRHQSQIHDLRLASQAIEKAAERFFTQENILALLYLVENPELRLATAEAVIKFLKIDDKTPADLIDKLDGHLITKWKCDSIQLHGQASQLSYQDYVMRGSVA